MKALLTVIIFAVSQTLIANPFEQAAKQMQEAAQVKAQQDVAAAQKQAILQFMGMRSLRLNIVQI